MGISGSIIAESASVGLLYAQRLLKGIPEDRAARNATPGGTQIVSNHPTFIIGHLCLYPLKVLELLGHDGEVTVWAKLDLDQDGRVTLTDLIAAARALPQALRPAPQELAQS